MLVHICCSVDSYYYIKRLREEFPDEPMIGFFDNPNIHPEEEWLLRLEESKKSCDYFGLPFIASDYEPEEWLEATKGLESEPEKGARCLVCFNHRLEHACRQAVKLGERRITTTLLMSPLKELGQLGESAAHLQERYGIEFVLPDYRKGGGTQAQQKMAHEVGTYRQDYCGCLFALGMQRAKQGRPSLELMTSWVPQRQIGSIAARLEFFRKKEDGIRPRRRRMLAWRLLRGSVSIEGEVVASYILSYSQLGHKRVAGIIEGPEDGVWYLSKGEVRFLEIEGWRRLTGRSDPDVTSLLRTPPSHQEEIDWRRHLLGSAFDLSVVVVVDRLEAGMRCSIEMESWLGEEVEWFTSL
ncbi:MAG: epoxyqueuosine reductase QueH [Campylobacterales bacterium]